MLLVVSELVLSMWFWLNLLDSVEECSAVFLWLIKNLWSLPVARKMFPAGLSKTSTYVHFFSFYWNWMSAAQITAQSGTGSLEVIPKSSFVYYENDTLS